MCYSLKVSQLSSLTTEACVWCDSERCSPVLPTVSHVLWGRWMSLQGSLEKRDDHFILRMDSTAQEEPNHPILHSAASEQTVKTISRLRSAAIKKHVFLLFCFKEETEVMGVRRRRVQPRVTLLLVSWSKTCRVCLNVKESETDAELLL